jgi:phosphohistidine phosphatase
MQSLICNKGSKEAMHMKLYLVQHGNALSKEQDPQRPLSEKGTKDVSRVAEFLKEKYINVEALWHSGKTRAAQTARILGSALGKGDGLEHEGLAPNDDVQNIARQINSADGNIMIVGHLPFLSKLASLLLVGDESADIVNFNQAGVVCLQSDDANWSLSWIITPQLIGN